MRMMPCAVLCAQEEGEGEGGVGSGREEWGVGERSGEWERGVGRGREREKGTDSSS